MVCRIRAQGCVSLSDGRAHLDTGAIVAALELAADVRATVVGKPSTTFLDLGLRLVPGEVDLRRTWVVGDDRSSDIVMGRAAAQHVIDSVALLPAMLRRERS